MNLELVTLTGSTLYESIYEVILSTPDGEISIFPDHEALVTLVSPGVIAIRRRKIDTDEQIEYYAGSGGVAEIGHNRIRLLVDEAESGDEIVESETQAAYERALNLQKTAQDQVELEKAHQLVDRHAVRLKVAGLRRRKRSL